MNSLDCFKYKRPKAPFKDSIKIYFTELCNSIFSEVKETGYCSLWDEFISHRERLYWLEFYAIIKCYFYFLKRDEYPYIEYGEIIFPYLDFVSERKYRKYDSVKLTEAHKKEISYHQAGFYFRFIFQSTDLSEINEVFYDNKQEKPRRKLNEQQEVSVPSRNLSGAGNTSAAATDNTSRSYGDYENNSSNSETQVQPPRNHTAASEHENAEEPDKNIDISSRTEQQENPKAEKTATSVRNTPDESRNVYETDEENEENTSEVSGNRVVKEQSLEQAKAEDILNDARRKANEEKERIISAAKAKADEESRRIISDAETEAKKVREKALETAEEESRRIISDAEEESRRIISEAEEDKERLISETQTTCEKAIKAAEEDAQAKADKLINSKLAEYYAQRESKMREERISFEKEHEENAKDANEKIRKASDDTMKLQREIAMSMDEFVKKIDELKHGFFGELSGWREGLYESKYNTLAMVYISMYTITNRNILAREKEVLLMSDTDDTEELKLRVEKLSKTVKDNAKTLERLLKSFEKALSDMGLQVYYPKEGEEFNPYLHSCYEGDTGDVISRCVSPGIKKVVEDDEDNVIIQAEVEVKSEYEQ